MLHLRDEGSGKAVVLLHAYPCDGTMWDAQAVALLDAGYRVLRPDLPGFGASVVSRESPSLDVMADGVLDVVEQTGVESFALAGLSMGGYVAMQILRQQPSRVTALALLDTKASPDAPQARQARLETAGKAEIAGSLADMAEGMLPGLLGATTLAQRPAAVLRTRDFIERASGAGAAWAMRAMATRPDSVATLAAFGGPAVVIMGEEDALSPRDEHEAMAAALPLGSLVTIPACGHLSALEQPDAVSNALLTFLDASL